MQNVKLTKNYIKSALFVNVLVVVNFGLLPCTIHRGALCFLDLSHFCATLTPGSRHACATLAPRLHHACATLAPIVHKSHVMLI